MKFTLRHGKHQKSPSTAQAPNQPIQLKAATIPVTNPNTASEFESVALLGPNPNVETVDCKGIANAILDHFDRWYSGIKKDGSTDEDIVDLLKEMMMYATRNHPMVMASPVAGPEVISIIFNDVLERIEDAPDE